MNKKLNVMLGKIVRNLRRYRPEKIILYGSTARGAAGRDIDLLVIKKTAKNYFDRLREIDQKYLDRWSSGLPVDLTVYTPKELAEARQQKRVFIDQVERYGRVLYQKSA